MKIRNGWKSSARQWDKLRISLRLSYVDILTVEVDISREFYLLTLFNFTIKNR